MGIRIRRWSASRTQTRGAEACAKPGASSPPPSSTSRARRYSRSTTSARPRAPAGGSPYWTRTQDASTADPVGALATGELRDQPADAIARLPERERLVVGLYYYENLTLAEIAEVLGVTEPRASQLRARAILRLQSKLEDKHQLAAADG